MCESLSDRLLSEVFGQGGRGWIESCEDRVHALDPIEDRTLVSFEPATLEDDHATLTMIDEGQELRYTLAFVRQDGAWLVDAADGAVEYTLDGERERERHRDRVSLVRRDGEWLVDDVVLAGFVTE